MAIIAAVLAGYVYIVHSMYMNQISRTTVSEDCSIVDQQIRASCSCHVLNCDVKYCGGPADQQGCYCSDYADLDPDERCSLCVELVSYVQYVGRNGSTIDAQNVESAVNRRLIDRYLEKYHKGENLTCWHHARRPERVTFIRRYEEIIMSSILVGFVAVAIVICACMAFRIGTCLCPSYYDDISDGGQSDVSPLMVPHHYADPNR